MQPIFLIMDMWVNLLRLSIRFILQDHIIIKPILKRKGGVLFKVAGFMIPNLLRIRILP